MKIDWPICHPQPPSFAFGKILRIIYSISFLCCASPSFIINWTRSLIYFGMTMGTACWKTHLKLILCSLGIHIHKNTTCLSTNILHANLQQGKDSIPITKNFEIKCKNRTLAEKIINNVGIRTMVVSGKNWTYTPQPMNKYTHQCVRENIKQVDRYLLLVLIHYSVLKYALCYLKKHLLHFISGTSRVRQIVQHPRFGHSAYFDYHSIVPDFVFIVQFGTASFNPKKLPY